MAEFEVNPACANTGDALGSPGIDRGWTPRRSTARRIGPSAGALLVMSGIISYE